MQPRRTMPIASVVGMKTITAAIAHAIGVNSIGRKQERTSLHSELR
jgi:hypothetical protein